MFNYLATIGSTVSWICIDIKICVWLLQSIQLQQKYKF
jgi:hypothetical protein